VEVSGDVGDAVALEVAVEGSRRTLLITRPHARYLPTLTLPRPHLARDGPTPPQPHPALRATLPSEGRVWGAALTRLFYCAQESGGARKGGR
jgi:hypothetical protein